MSDIRRHTIAVLVDNEPGVLARVAVHATLRPLDFRRSVAARDVEDVENPAEFRVDRNDFEPSAWNVADVDVLVEVERARVLRRDEPQLQARRGENQHLRRNRHVEPSE